MVIAESLKICFDFVSMCQKYGVAIPKDDSGRPGPSQKKTPLDQTVNLDQRHFVLNSAFENTTDFEGRTRSKQ